MAPPKSHTIHLRLRLAQNHQFLFDYHQVAESMAHEMAHCVYRHHKASFYQLMDEILIEHAKLVASGSMLTRPTAERSLQYHGIQHIR